MENVSTVVLSHGPTAGLNLIRALNRYGIPTIAILFDDSVASHSHLPQMKIVVAGESHQEKETNLLSILQSLELGYRPVLLATSDRLLDFLCAHRSELESRYALLLPSSDLVRTLNDKAAETRFVAGLGFATPKTVGPLPVDPRELEEELGFPLMIKLRKHEFWSVLGRKNLIIRSREQLHQFYSLKSPFADRMIAQELIEGTDDASWICTASFDRSHELMAVAMKRKVRMAPPHYGDASIAVSAPNPELRDIVVRLGRAMGCVGVAGFEFRWDTRDGQYKYIEMNPRFGSGCSSAEYDAHMAIPTAQLAYRLALDLPVAPVTQQRDGVLYRNFGLDLVNRIHHEKLGAILRHHARLAWTQPVHEQYASLSDPMPALAAWARTLMRPLPNWPALLRRPRRVAEQQSAV